MDDFKSDNFWSKQWKYELNIINKLIYPDMCFILQTYSWKGECQNPSKLTLFQNWIYVKLIEMQIKLISMYGISMTV